MYVRAVRDDARKLAPRALLPVLSRPPFKENARVAAGAPWSSFLTGPPGTPQHSKHSYPLRGAWHRLVGARPRESSGHWSQLGPAPRCVGVCSACRHFCPSGSYTRAVVIYEMVAIEPKVIRPTLSSGDQVLATGGGGRDVLRTR